MKRTAAIFRLRHRLLARRAALRATLDSQRSTLQRPRAGVRDAIDEALVAEQNEVESQLVGVESQELERIDAALERFERGRFGVCEACGRNIPLARLQAIPYADQCIRCQRAGESAGHQHIDSPPVGRGFRFDVNSFAPPGPTSV